MQKKVYSAPRLTVHGTIESVTQGLGHTKFLDYTYVGGTGFACDPVPGTPYTCGPGEIAS